MATIPAINVPGSSWLDISYDEESGKTRIACPACAVAVEVVAATITGRLWLAHRAGCKVEREIMQAYVLEGEA